MRFKKLAALGLAAVMACSLAVPASAEYVEDKELTIETALASDSDDEFSYSRIGGLTSYNGTAENVVIPDYVSSISATAFAGNKTVKTITIPANTDSIALGAFSDCPALTTIKVNSANRTYESENGVLYRWVNKEKYLHTYPAAKTAKRFTVPSGVSKVLSNAFKGTSKLQTLKLSNTVEELNDLALSGSKSLKTVTITKKLTTIGKDVFLNSPKLQSITGGNTKFGNGDGYVTKNGVLYSWGGWDLLCYPEGKTDKTFAMPDEFTGMSYGAQLNNTAIRNNKYLQKITLWGNMQLYDKGYFSGCSSLASIEVREVEGKRNTLSVKNGVLFGNSNNLIYYPAAKKDTSYTVPKDTIVPSCAFADTTKLKTLTLSEGVKIPSVLSDNILGNGTSSVAAIKVSSKHKELSAKDGILYNKDKTTLICVPPQCEKASLKLPTSVNNIYSKAFTNCKKIESVEIPRGVTEVFFTNCSALKTVTLPVGIRCIAVENRVDSDAIARFTGCGSLSKITYKGNRSDIEYYIPEGVKLVCADD